MFSRVQAVYFVETDGPVFEGPPPLLDVLLLELGHSSLFEQLVELLEKMYSVRIDTCPSSAAVSFK